MSQYATATELQNFGIPAAALSGISPTIQNQHLTLASGKIDSYLRGRYSLPLVSPFPDEIIAATCALAAYTLLKRRGFNPDAYDSNFRDEYLSTLEWLVMLSEGKVNLCVDADATPTTQEGRPSVYSAGYRYTYGEVEGDEHRGW
jgi:phage gp36-like protein